MAERGGRKGKARPVKAKPIKMSPITASAPRANPMRARASGPPLLAVKGVQRSFGGVTAVDVHRLDVANGGMVALIGPNGAGKTALLDVLTGHLRADAGQWSFAGLPMAGSSPDEIARAGIARTFQIPRLWSKLSVVDNVRLGAAGHPGEHLGAALIRSRWRGRELRIDERARALLDDVRMARQHDVLAGALPSGQRKLVELARALMSEPRMLVLDEPTAGVGAAAADRLATQLARLHERGLTILVVEHDLDLVARLGMEVACLASGRVIARGTPTAVLADPAVIDALGRSRTARS